jgi:predicted DNA-binding transcriptional regulator AlpA
MPNIDKILTDRQVAARFGVNRSSVWRWVKLGILPKPIKIGGSTRWMAAEIRAVIEKGKAARNNPAPARKRTRVREHEPQTGER